MAIGWHIDLDAALEVGAKTELPLFVDFWAYG